MAGVDLSGRGIAQCLSTVLLIAAALAGPSWVLLHESARSARVEQHRSAVERETADLARVAEAIAAMLSIQPGTVTGTGLAATADLVGFGRPVPADRRTALERATVMLVRRTAELDGWTRSCTATLVRIDGAVYVLTAQHCFEQDLRPLDDVRYDDAEPDLRDLTTLTTARYGVIVATEDLVDLTPRTRLTRIAAPVDRSADLALATVADLGQLDGVEPIEIGLASADARPDAGQEVAMYSYPSSVEPNAVVTTGTYVGRSRRPVVGGYSSPIDIVAIDPAGPMEDACFYGASGSSAVLADGTVLGPLGSRSTIGYGPDRVLFAQDTDGSSDRRRVEDALHVDLERPAVLCAYAVLDHDSLRALVDVVHRNAT